MSSVFYFGLSRICGHLVGEAEQQAEERKSERTAVLGIVAGRQGLNFQFRVNNTFPVITRQLAGQLQALHHGSD